MRQLGLLPCDFVSFVAELFTRFFTGKLPIDSSALAIHSLPPSLGLSGEVAERGNPTSPQALPREKADFDLSLIQPAAVGWGVMHGKPIPEPTALLLPVSLHHGFTSMRTQIVHD